MTLRYISFLALFVMLIVLPIRFAAAEDFIYGCWSRPACGKVCKLVCEKQTLVSTCYACECAEICIPAPSRPGCKHCATCCDCEPKDDADACCRQACCEKGPKCEFCWRDWIACGCARPRTVKVLTKYQAEKEICWYHWEVVDAAECDGAGVEEKTAHRGGPAACECVYKPAPADVELGARLALSDDERVQLSAFLTNDEVSTVNDTDPVISPTAEATADVKSDSADASLWQRISRRIIPANSSP